MTLSFTINLDHYEQVATAINQAFDEDKQEEILEDAAGKIETQTRERFDSETAPDGKKWKRWSKKYAAKRPSGKSLLQDSGLLLQSIEAEIGKNQATVGINSSKIKTKTGRDYSAKHQFGFKKKNIPARPFIGLNQSNEQEIINAIEDILNQ